MLNPDPIPRLRLLENPVGAKGARRLAEAWEARCPDLPLATATARAQWLKARLPESPKGKVPSAAVVQRCISLRHRRGARAEATAVSTGCKTWRLAGPCSFHVQTGSRVTSCDNVIQHAPPLCRFRRLRWLGKLGQQDAQLRALRASRLTFAALPQAHLRLRSRGSRRGSTSFGTRSG